MSMPAAVPTAQSFGLAAHCRVLPKHRNCFRSEAATSDNGTHQSAPVTQTHAAAAQAPAGKQTDGAPVNGAARAPSTGKGPPKAAAKKPKAFANNNRFLVPEDKLESFQATWADRAAEMKQFPGFQGFDISHQSDGTWLTVSRWETIPQWEAYSLSPEARRSHLPWGVYQFVPDKGAGFPEDFVPFKDLNRPVNAKY